MATTTRPKAEVMAQRQWTGGYDFTFQAKLIRYGDQIYLLIDHFVGWNSLSGACPRAHLYVVPDELVAEVSECFERPSDDLDPKDPGLFTFWEYLEEYLIAKLESHGLAGRRFARL